MVTLEELDSCLELFVECLCNLAPAGQVTLYTRRNFAKSLDELLRQSDSKITAEYFKKVVFWASRQQVFKNNLLKENPHWWLTKNWTRLSFEYSAAHSHGEPSEASKEVANELTEKAKDEWYAAHAPDDSWRNPHLTSKSASRLREIAIENGWNFKGLNAAIINAGLEPLPGKERDIGDLISEIETVMDGTEETPF